MSKIFKQVPRAIFGEGSLERIESLFPDPVDGDSVVVYVVDDVLEEKNVQKRIPLQKEDVVHWFPATKHEPTVDQIDLLKEETVNILSGKIPRTIVGVGGGSTLDVAKALSVVLKNAETTSAYQGWDKVTNKAVHKIGVPTVAGSGAEASRTAVLFGRGRKQGINSDESMFDAVVLDSSLISTVPETQRFFSGMDCYIHCVESLQGTMINELSKGYASKGLELCSKVFLDGGNDDELMASSFLGGASIVNSEVGLCHALSYGLSMQLGIRHGQANCIAFRVLEDMYGDSVRIFEEMAMRSGVDYRLPVSEKLDNATLDLMIDSALAMEKPLENAFGQDWKSIATRDRLKQYYMQM